MLEYGKNSFNTYTRIHVGGLNQRWDTFYISYLIPIIFIFIILYYE